MFDKYHEDFKILTVENCLIKLKFFILDLLTFKSWSHPSTHKYCISKEPGGALAHRDWFAHPRFGVHPPPPPIPTPDVWYYRHLPPLEQNSTMHDHLTNPNKKSVLFDSILTLVIAVNTASKDPFDYTILPSKYHTVKFG